MSLDLPDGRGRFSRELTATSSNLLCIPLVERSLGPLSSGAERFGLNPTDIDEVVLVGGSRACLVRQRVQALFGKDRIAGESRRSGGTPELQYKPVFTNGGTTDAAVDVTRFVARYRNHGRCHEQLDPTQYNGYASARKCSRPVDGQTGVDIHTFSGRTKFGEVNRSLAAFVSRFRHCPAELPLIEVTFLIDVMLFLNVMARTCERPVVRSRSKVKPSYRVVGSKSGA